MDRFLFVLLGPPGKAKSYNEIGRAIATLMVDDVSLIDVLNSSYFSLLIFNVQFFQINLDKKINSYIAL